MPIKRETLRNKDGLSREAFAVIIDIDDPETWKLPHHKGSVSRFRRGKPDDEKTVDWPRMPAAVAALSPRLQPGQRLDAAPGKYCGRLNYLTAHYRAAAKPLPDILAALV